MDKIQMSDNFGFDPRLKNFRLKNFQRKISFKSFARPDCVRFAYTFYPLGQTIHCPFELNAPTLHRKSTEIEWKTHEHIHNQRKEQANIWIFQQNVTTKLVRTLYMLICKL